MISQLDFSSDFALDMKSVGKLKLAAKTDSNATLKEVAKQFESLFVNMMIKSMRDATPKDGPFDSSQSDLYTGILDQQLSQKLSSKGGLGLADFMVKQLTHAAVDPNEPLRFKRSGEIGISLVAKPLALSLPPTNATYAAPVQAGANSANSATPDEFVGKLWPHAAETSQALGIPAHFLIGHAALESGWGQRKIRDAAGNDSYNLFGIKAGKNWTGAVVETTTTEYVKGVPNKSVEKFRAYDGYADAFRDYASVLRNNPRYASALEPGQDAAGFARGLQQGGYATDPLYANKLNTILNGKVMQQALTTA